MKETIIILLVIIVVLQILIWAKSKPKGISDDNTDTFSGTTTWKPCMYCPTCKEVYDQSGLNISVYTCPGCGKSTIYKSFRYHNDKLEITDRS